MVVGTVAQAGWGRGQGRGLDPGLVLVALVVRGICLVRQEERQLQEVSVAVEVVVVVAL